MPTSDPSPSIHPGAYNGASGIVAPPEGAGATFAPVRQRGRAAPAQGAQGAPLGPRTISPSPPVELRSKQRGILRRYRLQEAAAELLPGHRVAWCGCVPVKELISVLYHPEHSAASYGGLAVCGNPWVCPLCSTKIAARRAEELGAGVASWRARGGDVVMVTFTLRHHKGQRLKKLLEALNGAYAGIRSDARWVKFVKRTGIAGTVTGREMPHGSNGWHPHLHALFFLEKPVSNDYLDVMKGWIYHRWCMELNKYGFDATKQHGVHISRARNDVDDYVTKAGKSWSTAQEVANAPAKEGEGKSRTPQQLLALYAAGNKAAGELFKEYAEAVRNRTPLFWSQGLRKKVFGDEEEKSDAELAAETREEAEEIIVLTHEQWSKLVRYRLRGDLLADICDRNYDGTVKWLASCGIELDLWQLRYTLKGEKG